MKTIFVKDLSAHLSAPITEHFVCSSVTTGGKEGRTWYDVELSDATGTVSCKIWGEQALDSHPSMEGKLVKITGDVRLYQGKPTITVSQMVRASFEGMNEEDFLPKFSNLDGVGANIKELISKVGTPHYRALLDRIFGEESFFKRFMKCQGGQTIHHTAIGGVAVHTVAVTTGCVAYAHIYETLGRNNGLDVDLLITGALLHDIGKLKEYKYFPDNKRTMCGILQGHLNMSYGMVYAVIREMGKDFPDVDAAKLLHLILSSHGDKGEMTPASKEAVILSRMDSLDSLVDGYDQTILSDASDEEFTAYNRYFGTYVLKS